MRLVARREGEGLKARFSERGRGCVGGAACSATPDPWPGGPGFPESPRPPPPSAPGCPRSGQAGPVSGGAPARPRWESTAGAAHCCSGGKRRSRKHSVWEQSVPVPRASEKGSASLPLSLRPKGTPPPRAHAPDQTHVPPGPRLPQPLRAWGSAPRAHSVQGQLRCQWPCTPPGLGQAGGPSEGPRVRTGRCQQTRAFSRLPFRPCLSRPRGGKGACAGVAGPAVPHGSLPGPTQGTCSKYLRQSHLRSSDRDKHNPGVCYVSQRETFKNNSTHYAWLFLDPSQHSRHQLKQFVYGCTAG